MLNTVEYPKSINQPGYRFTAYNFTSQKSLIRSFDDVCECPPDGEVWPESTKVPRQLPSSLGRPDHLPPIKPRLCRPSDLSFPFEESKWLVSVNVGQGAFTDWRYVHMPHFGKWISIVLLMYMCMDLCVYLYVYVYVCICVYMYVYLCVQFCLFYMTYMCFTFHITYICVAYISMNDSVRAFVCMFVFVYVRACVCICSPPPVLFIHCSTVN